MIEDLKLYPEYKESGLSWLGEVPAHWSLIPNRGLIRRRKVLVGERHCEYLLLSLTKQGVIVRDLSTSKGKFSSDMGTSQEVRIGDLVFCLFDVPETPRTVGLSTHAGMITGAYTVFEPLDRCCATYFELFYRAMDERKLLSPLYSGLRNTIPAERFLAVKTPQPPPEEQAAIARFLAWASNRLDRAIGAKRRIIALLQDQKQAIIHHAVTRGLDPSVPLKDSGIPWLGKIPEHWEVRRLRTVVKTIDQGVSPLATGFLAEGNSWGVLKSGCVNRGVFRETEHKQLSQSFKIDSSIVVKPGDVLISRACGSPSLVGSVGRVGKLHYNLILSDKTFRPNFEESVDVDFMVLAMNSTYYRRQVEQAISGAEGMANNLPISSLRDFSLAIPPLDEAKAIAFSINKRLAGINLAIASNEQEITLLREYRTRLIADVVTGNLDVREAAAGLPEEIEPPIQSDAAGYDGDEAEDDSDSDPIDTEED
jgi:type I restriction enzyme S subunit